LRITVPRPAKRWCRRRSWRLRVRRSPSCSECWARRRSRTRSSSKPWSTPPKKWSARSPLLPGEDQWRRSAGCWGWVRLHIHDLRHRADGWRDGRSGRTLAGDARADCRNSRADRRTPELRLPACVRWWTANAEHRKVRLGSIRNGP